MDYESFENMNFRLPGPTPLPPTVRKAMDRPAIHHRGPLLKSLMSSITRRLQAIHKTEGDVLVWPGSGSAGWEIAITNMLSPGDKVLVTVCGDFGDRFARVATKLGLDVHRIDQAWGEAITASRVTAALEALPDCRAVLVTHNETSTGVTNPLREIASVIRDAGALIIVDAVSSASALPLETDAWGLDAVISGSQKAWMCPPGLVICAFGPRAFEAYERSAYHRFFWDIKSARDYSRDGMTLATPPLQMFFALDAALDLMMDEGIENIWQRHAQLGAYARERVTGIGLELLADADYASNSLTAIRIPEGFTARPLIDHMITNHRVMLQAGQGALSETVLRVGHMGWVNHADLAEAFNALESTVASLRVPVRVKP